MGRGQRRRPRTSPGRGGPPVFRRGGPRGGGLPPGGGRCGPRPAPASAGHSTSPSRTRRTASPGPSPPPTGPSAGVLWYSAYRCGRPSTKERSELPEDPVRVVVGEASVGVDPAAGGLELVPAGVLRGQGLGRLEVELPPVGPTPQVGHDRLDGREVGDVVDALVEVHGD